MLQEQIKRGAEAGQAPAAGDQHPQAAVLPSPADLTAAISGQEGMHAPSSPQLGNTGTQPGHTWDTREPEGALGACSPQLGSSAPEAVVKEDGASSQGAHSDCAVTSAEQLEEESVCESADEPEGGDRHRQAPRGTSRANNNSAAEQPTALYSSSGSVEPLPSSGADASSTAEPPAQLPSGAGEPLPFKETSNATTGSATAGEPAAAALVQPCHPQAGNPAGPPQPAPAKPAGTSGRRAQPGKQRKQRGCCTSLRRLLAPCCGGCFGRAPSTGVSPLMTGSRASQPSHWERESWAPSTGSCSSSPSSTSAASLRGLIAAAAPGSSATAPASQQQERGTGEGRGRAMDSAPCEVPAGSLPGAEESTPPLLPTSSSRWASVQPHIIAHALDTKSLLPLFTERCSPSSASLPISHSGSAVVSVRVPDTLKLLQGLQRANKGAT